MASRTRVVIVGAGVGGVASAARLAKAGLDVTVVEKNDFTGGRCSLIHKDGHRFDTGPSLLLLPSLFHQAFAELGTSLKAEGVELLKCEPNYKVFFHDGEPFTLSTDLPTMAQGITPLEGSLDGYLGFLQEAGAHHGLSLKHVLNANFGSLASMLRPGFLRHLFTLHPFESIWTRASKHFETDRLRRVFTFASMYMGMSPFEAPGTYSLLQYTECVEGIWYPRGGFHTVVEALEKFSKRNGAKYRMATAVSSIVTDRGRVTGVKTITPNGEIEINADVVICNADLIYAYNELLPRSSYAERLTRKPQSCSSVSFYWSLSSRVPQLSIHNIFLAEAYRESFDDIFHGVGVPAEPSFYVNVPSHIDSSAAPPDRDSVIVLVPVASGDRAKIDVPALRKHILKTIAQRTGADLEPIIVAETVNTPQSWADAFNLHAGSILGLSHSFWNVLSFRPRIKHDSIRGLYFVGASTHPGTGVPVVLAGSGVTTREVLGDLKGTEVGISMWAGMAMLFTTMALVAYFGDGSAFQLWLKQSLEHMSRVAIN